MTYHLDWTVFLFAHTISEVLDLLAFILVFVAATRTVLARPRPRRARDADPPRRRAAAVSPSPLSSPWPRRLRRGRRSASPVATTTVDLPPSYKFAPTAIAVRRRDRDLDEQRQLHPLGGVPRRRAAGRSAGHGARAVGDVHVPDHAGRSSTSATSTPRT